MAFDDNQLEEIRAKIRVSEVVGARFPLIKKGSEYVAKDNPSFTVNDSKQIWCEYGSNGDGKGHTAFDFLTIYEGFSFVGAVEELAKRAGIALTHRPGRSIAKADLNGHAQSSEPRPDDIREAGPGDGRKDRPNTSMGAASGKREVVATWQYLDAENNLLYETVRMQERLPDGTWRLTKDQSKPWKTFMQRRPSPDGDGTWVLGLDLIDRETGEPLEFIKTEKSTAWLRATEDRLQWHNISVKTFPEASNVEHWLYNANAVIDELQEPKEDQRTIYIPEGESCVDIMTDWGMLAVTNSGGAKHFTEGCAEFFRNARHVVLLQDNDRAGAERVAKIAPMLKEVGVELIQSLNFHDVWPKCPPKGDVKDWRDQGGGTKDQLLEIIEQLKPWTPEPYKSKFGAKTAADLTGKNVRAYPWRIKGIMPMNDNMLLMGPSRSGKTFECLDMIIHVHNGQPFAGRKVVPCGFVYLTYEGATGFENRLRAYLKYHDMTPEDLHSFAWLTRPPNMFANEDNVVALASEIVEIAKTFQLPLGGIIIDTHNSATRGSSEIKSDDITKIMSNYDTVQQKTGAPLIVIGHTNAEGRHRGNEQFFNNIETAVLIERIYSDEKKKIERRDDEGRVVRRGKIMKQRDADDHFSWEFVLKSVVIGIDEDGENTDSMVSVEPAQAVPQEVAQEVEREVDQRERPDGFYLRGTNTDIFGALLRALDQVGRKPPPELNLPTSIATVITWPQLGIEYKKIDPQEDGEDAGKYRNRIKARTRRFREDLMKYGVIGIAELTEPAPVDSVDKPKTTWYVWPTGRRVYGRGLQWPPVPKKKKENKPILAPGETEGGLSGDIF